MKTLTTHLNSTLATTLALGLATLGGCVVHIDFDDDHDAPDAPDITDAVITGRATAQLEVTTPFDLHTGVEAFIVGVSSDDDDDIAETRVEATALYGDPQWLEVTGLRPGASHTVTVTAVDFAGNRSLEATIAPIETDFAYSGAILPANPEHGDNALGYEFARADFDGDGYSDIAVAAPFKAVAPAQGAGAVYIHRGSARGISAQPDAVIEGTTPFAQLGNALTTLDWNGDDVPDLVIGVPFAGNGDGVVSIYDGARLAANTMSGTPDATITTDGDGWYAGAALGFTLEALDYDGDGRDDLAIGAVAGGGTGGVLIATAGDSFDSLVFSENAAVLGDSSVTRITGGAVEGDLFGMTIANVGGTTAADAIAITGFQTGSLLVVHTDGDATAGRITDQAFRADHDLEIDGSELGPESYFGASLGALFTENGHELVIGAYRANDGDGLVALVPADLTGTHALSDVATATIAGDEGAQLGSAIANNAVAESGDVDGDGLGDLVLVGGSGELELLVWYGDALPAGDAWADSAAYQLYAPIGMNGEIPSIGGTPAAAAWVGDVDGDGLDDIGWADWTGNDGDGLFELLR